MNTARELRAFACRSPILGGPYSVPTTRSTTHRVNRRKETQ